MLTEQEETELAGLNREVDECRRCSERGFVAVPRPIDRGGARARFWLIGQAPGFGEGERKLAFGGPAGRTLMKWFERAGLAENQVRELFYMSAINKCYPGRAAGGGGDRNPTPLERALCRPYLLRELTLLRPRLVILIGSTAIKEVYGPQIKLEHIIGRDTTMPLDELYSRLYTRYNRTVEARQIVSDPLDPAMLEAGLAASTPVYHLPHPSGASTWLNYPQNRALLEQSLFHLRLKLAELL